MTYIGKKNIDLENIEESYDYIIRNLNKKCDTPILNILIIKKVNLDKLFNYIEKNNIKVNYNKVVKKLIELDKIELVKKYFNYFWKNNNHLLEFRYIVKKIGVNLEEVNNYINQNHDLIIEEVSNYSIKTLKAEKLYNFFKELVNELLKNEKIDYGNIEFIAEGTSSRVFEIGNKILKVGIPKETFKIRNNKLFLQPLYRKEIRSIYNNASLICIEITEKVDTKNITDDDVYYIYKTLRDEGLIWLDHTKDNVGRLIRDNKIYFDGINYVDKKSTDYTTDNYEILPKGSLVLIDNDCIYNAKEFFKTTDYRLFEHCSLYEARYREEKRNEKKSRV